jgi:hypothetical protein
VEPDTVVDLTIDAVVRLEVLVHPSIDIGPSTLAVGQPPSNASSGFIERFLSAESKQLKSVDAFVQLGATARRTSTGYDNLALRSVSIPTGAIAGLLHSVKQEWLKELREQETM